jgi:mercuric ion binding protein
MDCAACPITVRKSLERIEGVKVARVDVDASTMHLVVSNDAISDADLVAATANAGYQSRIGNKSP